MKRINWLDDVIIERASIYGNMNKLYKYERGISKSFQNIGTDSSQVLLITDPMVGLNPRNIINEPNILDGVISVIETKHGSMKYVNVLGKGLSTPTYISGSDEIKGLFTDYTIYPLIPGKLVYIWSYKGNVYSSNEDSVLSNDHILFDVKPFKGVYTLYISQDRILWIDDDSGLKDIGFEKYPSSTITYDEAFDDKIVERSLSKRRYDINEILSNPDQPSPYGIILRKKNQIFIRETY